MPVMDLLFEHEGEQRFYRAEGGRRFWGAADVRSLVPLILPAFAAGQRLYYAGFAGLRFRSWEGCKHAAVRRSGVPLASTRIFSNKWLDTHCP